MRFDRAYGHRVAEPLMTAGMSSPQCPAKRTQRVSSQSIKLYLLLKPVGGPRDPRRDESIRRCASHIPRCLLLKLTRRLHKFILTGVEAHVSWYVNVLHALQAPCTCPMSLNNLPPTPAGSHHAHSGRRPGRGAWLHRSARARPVHKLQGKGSRM